MTAASDESKYKDDNKRDERKASSSSTSSSSSSSSSSSLIEDSTGHVRKELATSIWEWDYEHRNHLDDDRDDDDADETKEYDDTTTTTKKIDIRNASKFQYSTRAGLRLVDELAHSFLEKELETMRFSKDRDEEEEDNANVGNENALHIQDSSTTTTTSSSSKSEEFENMGMTYSDLVQEGVFALMKAMSSYDPIRNESTHGKMTFEEYARQAIAWQMSEALASTSRPMDVHEFFAKAKEAAQVFRDTKSPQNKLPTLTELAQELGVSAQHLRLCLRNIRGPLLSVENTVESMDPSNSLRSSSGIGSISSSDTGDGAAAGNIMDNQDAHFVDKDRYEKENLPMPSQDERDLYETNEADEYYMQAIGALPLEETLQDFSSPTPDQSAAMDDIRKDMDDFLTDTLSEREAEVIRMRYGLSLSSTSSSSFSSSSAASTAAAARKGMTFREIGEQFGISKQRVHQIEQQALKKMRERSGGKFGYPPSSSSSLRDSGSGGGDGVKDNENDKN